MGLFAAILSLIGSGQIAFTGYNLYLSSIAIPKLLSYEDKAVKAAKYSNIAEEQLFKTRATQAASVGALILTLSTATPFLLLNYTSSTIFALSTVNLAVLLVTREYVGDFWKSKAKMPIPGTGDFNDAIGLTNEVRENQLFFGDELGTLRGCRIVGLDEWVLDGRWGMRWDSTGKRFKNMELVIDN